MKRRTKLLALLAAGLVTALAVAGFSTAASPTSAPSNTAPPKISGTPQVGNTLTATSGSWNGTTPITYHYQWLTCDKNGAGCSDLAGATSSSYLVRKRDVGNTLRVRVTAKNADGSAQATSNATAVVTKAPTAPPVVVNGCPVGSGPVSVTQVSPPARLLIDGQQVTPTTITRADSTITVRFHVSACNGRSVAGALVYATAVPYEQFSIPPETATDANGWATMQMSQERFFPASPRQGLLAVFVRARKPGETLLGGISTRRLVSFPVHV
jgi:hypothetical protein